MFMEVTVRNLMGSYARKNHGRPKDARVLKPGTYEYMTWHDKGEIADVIKVKNFEMMRLAWIIQMSLIQPHESLSPGCGQRKKCDDGGRVQEMWCEDLTSYWLEME